MFTLWKSIFLSSALALSGAVCAEKPEKDTPDIAKLSEALGHMIGKNLLDIDANLDISQVIKGLKDSKQGKQSPLSENECIAAMSSVQEKSFKEKSARNLKEAEEFLRTQATKEGIVSLEEGKVQYKIEKAGNGPAVSAHGAPIVKYVGKFIDGKEFGSAKEAESIALDELIPGLKMGLIGMKEGEKRTVYIHPNLGYGTAGMLPPNSLLCFDVEIVQAQAPNTDEITTNTEKKEAGSDVDPTTGDLL